MNREVEAIFIDSEGTLRDANHQIEEKTKNLIKGLEKEGIIVAVTTGLPRFIAQRISLKANANHFLIASNGADIYDLKREKPLISTFLPKETVQDIYDKNQDQFSLVLGLGSEEICNYSNEYSGNARIIQEKDLEEKNFFQCHISQRPSTLKTSFAKEELIYWKKNLELVKANIIINQDLINFLGLPSDTIQDDKIPYLLRLKRFIELKAFQERILKEHNDAIAIGNQSQDFTGFLLDGETPWFSLTRKDVSKGSGITRLCKFLSINPKNTIGIGNDYNDVTMQEAVDTFICPSNALLKLKERSDYTYDSEEGITKVLEKIYEDKVWKKK